MNPGTSRLTSLRAPDPEGGLPWGSRIARSKDGHIFCMQAGRVQDGKLGVVGRDGNVRRRRPLSPALAGRQPERQLRRDASSGVSGSAGRSTDPGQRVTGSFSPPPAAAARTCPPATIPPKTRRELRDVPVCADSHLRVSSTASPPRRG